MGSARLRSDPRSVHRRNRISPLPGGRFAASNFHDSRFVNFVLGHNSKVSFDTIVADTCSAFDALSVDDVSIEWASPRLYSLSGLPILSTHLAFAAVTKSSHAFPSTHRTKESHSGRRYPRCRHVAWLPKVQPPLDQWCTFEASFMLVPLPDHHHGT